MAATRSVTPSAQDVLERMGAQAGLPREALEILASAAEEGVAAEAQAIYGAATSPDHVYVVQSGSVRLERVGDGHGGPRWVGPGGLFGGSRPLQPAGESATSAGPSSLLRVSFDAIDRAIAVASPDRGAAFAAAVRGALDARCARDVHARGRTRQRDHASAAALLRVVIGRALGWLRAPSTYRRVLGYVLFFGAWYLAVEVLALPRFEKLPGIAQVVREWLSTDPMYGLSIHTPVYYAHIGSSLSRVGVAFLLATALGVPFGLGLGASSSFREYLFPLFELLRPVPIPAWVPLAIVVFSGAETPIVFVSFLGSFFATALNTFVGVRSIDPKYVLAARCLGARPWHLFRHVILPASIPFIVTGLQISIGLAWFSIAAAEMVSGQLGLGYLINTSYTMVQYPTIVIGMLTLGVLGFATSACVRLAGERFMVWRTRELALEGP